MGQHDIREITNKYAIDPTTGEVSEVTVGEYLGMTIEEKAHAEEKKRRVAARKERGTINRFVLLNPGVYARVVATLTGTQSRVLAMLIDDIRPREGSDVHVTSGRIADRLGVNTSVVSKALRQMEDRNILTRRIRGHLVLNPWLAYSGPAEDWRWATDEWDLPEGVSI